MSRRYRLDPARTLSFVHKLQAQGSLISSSAALALSANFTPALEDWRSAVGSLDVAFDQKTPVDIGRHMTSSDPQYRFGEDAL